MKRGSLLLIAAVAVGGACTDDGQASTTTAAAKTAASPVATNPAASADGAEACVHTDPAKQPISVHRALACPDGTKVWVRGVVVGSGTSTRLCDDAASSDNCLTISGDVLPTDAPSVAGPIFYNGTVSNGVLDISPPPFEVNGGSIVLSPLSRPSVPLHSG